MLTQEVSRTGAVNCEADLATATIVGHVVHKHKGNLAELIDDKVDEVDILGGLGDGLES